MKDAREAKAKKKAPEILIPELEKTPPPRPLSPPPVKPQQEEPLSPPVRQSNQALRAAAPLPETIPPPTNGIREQLMQRRYALDAARRAAHSAPIRKFYGK